LSSGGVDGYQYSVSGFWQEGDSGGGTYTYVEDYPKSEHDGGEIIDPGRVSQLVSQTDFGSYYSATTGTGCYVKFDKGHNQLTIGVYGASLPTVNTAILSSIAEIASIQNRDLYSPKGFILEGGDIDLKCGFVCDGTITMSVEDFSQITFLEDTYVNRTDLLPALMSAGELTKDNSILSALPPIYEGYTFRIYSADLLTERYNQQNNQTYYKGDVNVVGRLSKLEKPLQHSYVNPSSLTLSKSRPVYVSLSLDITGDGSFYTSTNSPISIQRSECTANINIKNNTSPYQPLAVGVSVSGCAKINISGSIDGTDYDGLGYAFLFTRTYRVTIKAETKVYRSRKAFDMTFAHSTVVEGGEYWCIPTSHVSYGLEVKNCYFYPYWVDGSYRIQFVCAFNGTDIEFSDNHVYNGDFDRPRFVSIRDDTAIRGGYLKVKNNKFYTEGTVGDMTIVEISTREDFNYGADINMFDTISIESNDCFSPNSQDSVAGPLTMVNDNTFQEAYWPSSISIKENTANGRYANGVLRMQSSAIGLPIQHTGGNVSADRVGTVDFNILNKTMRYNLEIKDSGSDSNRLRFILGYNFKLIKVYNSTVLYLLDKGESSEEALKQLFLFDACIINQSLSEFRYNCQIGFTRCYFENAVSLRKGEVVLSQGNFGVTQPFALNGLYTNFNFDA
jgi:hypothetical protein